MTQLLNLKKVLWSSVVIAFVASLVFAGTQAFFSDEETSEGNVFTAGAIDLLVDSEAHYNGMVCQLTDEGFIWVFPGGRDANQFPEGEEPYLWGTPCNGTWTETDLGPQHQFFNFEDLKPGDNGENTISLHVIDNDAYMCAIIDNMVTQDNDCNEPEEGAEADEYGEGNETCGDPGEGEGELQNELHFFAWQDDGGDGFGDEEQSEEGDNIWQENEQVLFSNVSGPASDVIDGVVYPLYTPETEAITGSTTHYIGLSWCFGEFSTEGGLSCDGASATNITQTDSLSADITFYAEQARNNDEFECPLLEEEREEVGTVLGEYQGPDPQDPNQCDHVASDDGTLSTALGNAQSGDTICVEDGTYQGPIDIEITQLSLRSVNPPTDTATINGGVRINAADATVSGFHIIPGTILGEVVGVYLQDAADGATVSFNDIDGSSLGGVPRGVVTETGADLQGVSVVNNVIHDLQTGIYTNPHTGQVLIQDNDIDDNVAGIGGLNGAMVLNNEFESTGGSAEAIGIDDTFDDNNANVNFNNFLDDTRINTYGTIDDVIDAENNFFNIGGATQVDETNGDVDFDPEEGSAFPHN